MATDRKLITVFGATGAQGGSVARSLLQNPSKWSVRGITRNADSASAKELASLGVEVVKANGFVKEEVLEAFKGSWGVFLNTNTDDPAFADPDAKPSELDLGKLLLDAASEAGVPHVIWSSVASSKKISNGQVVIPAMETKWDIELYAKSISSFKTCTACNAGWYLENFRIPELAQAFGGFPLFEDAEGYMTWHIPHWGGPDLVPWISIRDDWGDMIQGVFLNPEKWNGKTLQGVSDPISFGAMCEQFQQVTGKKARFDPLPSYEAMETHGVKFLENMKLVFELTQKTGGLYYEEQADTKDHAELKKDVWESMGKSRDDAKLITVKEWFAREYSGQKAGATNGTSH